MNQVCALGSLLRLEACVSARSGFHDRTPQTGGLKHRHLFLSLEAESPR